MCIQIIAEKAFSKSRESSENFMWIYHDFKHEFPWLLWLAQYVFNNFNMDLVRPSSTHYFSSEFAQLCYSLIFSGQHGQFAWWAGPSHNLTYSCIPINVAFGYTKVWYLIIVLYV